MKLAHHQSIYRGNCRTLVQVYDFMTQVIDIIQKFKRGFDTSNEKELLHLVQKQATEEVKLHNYLTWISKSQDHVEWSHYKMEWLILECQDYVVIYPVNKITIEPENLPMTCE